MKNEESTSVVISCEFSNDQKHIYSTTYEGVLNITNIEKKKQILAYKAFGPSKTVEDHALKCCRSVNNHPDGNLFLVGGENTKVSSLHFDPSVQFESQYLESRGTFVGHSDAIRHIEHNKQGDLMLSSCADHSLRIWDLQTTRCMALFAGHHGLVVRIKCWLTLLVVCGQIPKRNHAGVCLVGPNNLPLGLHRGTQIGPFAPLRFHPRRVALTLFLK